MSDTNKANKEAPKRFPNPKVTEMVIGGIPCSMFGLEELFSTLHYDTSVKVHVVFLLHGRGGDRYNKFIKDAATLLHSQCPVHKEGSKTFYLPIGVDQRNHGSRMPSLATPARTKKDTKPVDGQKFNKSWSEGNPTHAQDMYAVQLGTALDLVYLIDLLEIWLNVKGFGSSDLTSEKILSIDRVNVKINHWSVMGVSLGGHAALLTMCNDLKRPMHSCVAFIACGDYEKLMRHRLESEPFNIESPERLLPSELIEFVNKWDPIHHSDRIAPRPLLLYNTQKDTLVPAKENQAFVKKLTMEYERRGIKDRFKWVIEPGVEHKVTQGMLQRGVDWIVEWDAIHVGKFTNRL